MILIGTICAVLSFNSDPRAKILSYIFFFISLSYFYSIYLVEKLKKYILSIFNSKFKNNKKNVLLKKNIEISLIFYRSLTFTLIFPIFFFIVSKFLFILFSLIWVFLFIIYVKFRNILKSEHILFFSFLIVIIYFNYIHIFNEDIWSPHLKEYFILSFVIIFLIFRYWLSEITRLVNLFYQMNNIKNSFENKFFLKNFFALILKIDKPLKKKSTNI